MGEGVGGGGGGRERESGPGLGSGAERRELGMNQGRRGCRRGRSVGAAWSRPETD